MSAAHLVSGLVTVFAVSAPCVALAAGDSAEDSDLLVRVINVALLMGVLWYFARKPIQAFFEARRDEFLPNAEDYAYVQTLMKPCHEPGKYASWIAAPRKGINGRPEGYEYVKFASRG